MMKKILIFAMMLVLICFSAGCGKSDDPGTGGTSADEGSSSTVTESAPKAENHAMDDQVKTKKYELKVSDYKIVDGAYKDKTPSAGNSFATFSVHVKNLDSSVLDLTNFDFIWVYNETNEYGEYVGYTTKIEPDAEEDFTIGIMVPSDLARDSAPKAVKVQKNAVDANLSIVTEAEYLFAIQ